VAALTDVAICNLAQEKLGAEHIASLASPQGTAARRYALIYPHYRDVELRARRWRFALDENVSLTALVGYSTDEDYPHRYLMPPNTLRLVRDSRDRWKQVGDEVWAQDASGLKVDIIRSDIEPGRFDPNFVDVLACRLAFEACEKTTQSNSKRAEQWEARREALKVAGQVNAFITGPESYDADDSQYSWLTERAL